MTGKEKMQAGIIYNPLDPKIAAKQVKYLEKLYEFNDRDGTLTFPYRPHRSDKRRMDN